MNRAFSALAVAGLSVISAGCAVCGSPYDECSPTFLGGCDEHCVTDDRAGSIITSAYGGEYVAEEAPASPDDAAEEVPLPQPIPDPDMQQPAEELQPMPQAAIDSQRQQYRAPRPAAQRGRHPYAPMTLRPQRNQMR